MNVSTIHQRVRTLLGAKLAVGLFIFLWVGTPYFATQHIQFFDSTLMPSIAIDQAIPFNDHTVWVYLSMYLLVPITVLMFTHAYELRRFAIGAGLLGLVSGLVFVFFPTSIERPPESEVKLATLCYRVMVSMDKPVNAFPSLHASLCVFAATLGHDMLRRADRSWIWRALLWLWLAAILYSTLSTRQHVFIDIAAGGAMGAIAFAAVRYLIPAQSAQLESENAPNRSGPTVDSN